MHVLACAGCTCILIPDENKSHIFLAKHAAGVLLLNLLIYYLTVHSCGLILLLIKGYLLTYLITTDTLTESTLRTR